MISKSIEQLQLEEIDGEWVCTILYKRFPKFEQEARKSTLVLSGMDSFEKKSVTQAMYEVGMILGLNFKTKTLDFNLTKEVPEGLFETEPDLLTLVSTPGKTYWLATGYR